MGLAPGLGLDARLGQREPEQRLDLAFDGFDAVAELDAVDGWAVGDQESGFEDGEVVAAPEDEGGGAGEV